MRQCPNLLDGSGTPSASPVWVSCTGLVFNLFLQPDDTLFAYSIDFGDGSPAVIGDTLLPSGFETHPYAAGTANYPVTVTAACGVITGTVILEVTPSASIQIPLGSPTYGCAPATYSFENASTNVSTNTSFTWDWGDGSPLETYGDTNWGDTLYHVYLPGTVSCDVMVTLTASNNCPPISTNTYFPIQVWEVDIAEITASAVLLCYPDTVVHFDNTTTKNCLANGNTSQRYEYWNFGDYWGLGYDSIIPWQPWSPPARPGYDIAYPGIGSYDVMLIDSSFCGQDTAYITVSIVAQPVAVLSSNPDTICVGQSVDFSNLSVGANAYSWNFGDGSGWMGSGGGSENNTYFTAGNFTVYLVATISGGSPACIDTSSLTVEVLPAPQAIFSGIPNSGCDSLDVLFSDASISAAVWLWDFDNGDTSTSPNPPVISYTNPGLYTTQLLVTSANGCKDSATFNLSVHETPVVSFTAPGVCVNQVTGFTDASTAGTEPITGWDWDFGDGGTDTVQNPTNIYTSAGPKTVTLTVSTGFCSASDSLVVQADTLPQASFSADTSSGCSPLNTAFFNSSSGALSYQWDFGDGGSYSGFDTSHTFLNAGPADTTYDVRLIAITGSGCVDTAYLPVIVHPLPVVSFTSNAAPGCSPLQVAFTDGSAGASQYLWDFGDGSSDTVSTNPVHLFTNPTVFILIDTVELVGISAFGCSDTSSATVTIYPSANSVIAVPDSGCSPMSVQFTSTLTGAVLFDWDFGDGFTSMAQNPVHNYINPSTNDTTYTARLVVTSGFFCVDTSYVDVVVFAKPSAQFSVDTIQGCGPLPVSFSNSSTGASGYDWDFGDGFSSDTTAANFSHTYSNVSGVNQLYAAQLIVTSANGCLDTAQITIQVYSTVFAAFAQPDTAGCSPLSVSFSNGSLFSDYHVWDFGDGSVPDTSVDPVHEFSNSGITDTVFFITLAILSNDGCADTAYGQVAVYPAPTADFAATPVSQLFPGTTVNLVNLSSAGSWSYYWDFGDGTSDTAMNPSPHSYTAWNDYTIELTVSDLHCSDTATAVVVILQPPPDAGFTLSDTGGCRALNVIFNDTSLYADSLMWDFGDGTPFYFTADTASFSHTYYNAGTYAVSLTAFGFGGSPDTKQGSVTVYELPVAAFALNPNPAIIYLPDKPVYCVNLSGNADTYQWDFGDGMSSTEVSPAHIYTVTGSYDIRLIAASAFGCLDTLVKDAAVTVEEGGDILFPTAFSPDPSGPGDGIYDPNGFDNNIFHPYWDGVESYVLRVFNRWGELIFETEDINIGWDGYYRGEMAQQDVYVWKATVLFKNGAQRTMAGDVTLLR